MALARVEDGGEHPVALGAVVLVRGDDDRQVTRGEVRSGDRIRLRPLTQSFFRPRGTTSTGCLPLPDTSLTAPGSVRRTRARLGDPAPESGTVRSGCRQVALPRVSIMILAATTLLGSLSPIALTLTLSH
jgi:hypothetical protein